MVASLRSLRLSSTVITPVVVVVVVVLLPLSNINVNNALLQPQSVFAQVQQQEEEAFLTYENPDHGIFIQYPSDWTDSTSGLADYTDLIAFYSPLQNVSDSSQARLVISVVVYAQNVSLQEYTNFVSTTLNQSEQVEVISSSEVTVAGHPGHRVVLASQPLQNSTLIFYQMNTWTTIGNKVYFLAYEGDESAFNQHLSEASRMLESLTLQG